MARRRSRKKKGLDVGYRPFPYSSSSTIRMFFSSAEDRRSDVVFRRRRTSVSCLSQAVRMPSVHARKAGPERDRVVHEGIWRLAAEVAVRVVVLPGVGGRAGRVDVVDLLPMLGTPLGVLTVRAERVADLVLRRGAVERAAAILAVTARGGGNGRLSRAMHRGRPRLLEPPKWSARRSRPPTARRGPAPGSDQ